MASLPPSDSDRLDQLPRLPGRAWLSVALVLAVTALNAFNDNILKMMLVGLAPKVAEGALGREIGAWLGAMILLPFILFAPLAGYFADRFSKRSVILAMLVAQAVILLLAGACFQAAWNEWSIVLALGCFFLLAAQSTFFSPGKMGILKELAGSRRLGLVSGWLQMLTMIGILAGLGAGGAWFDALYAASGNPWQAAARPIWFLFAVALVALAGGWFIQSTPSHPEVRYRHRLWWEHFTHLRESLVRPAMRRAFLGNSTYWFVASMAAAMFVDIGMVLHPDRTAAGAASAASHMTLMVGLGTVAGSLFVSWVNRKSLQLGLIPLGALGLAGSLLWAAFVPVASADFEWALAAIGFTGGCYMVPIQTYIQDRADPERRGRVLASMNLLDSVAGVAAVAFLVLLKALGLDFRGQFLVLAGLMLVATVYVFRLLPDPFIRLVARAVVKALYHLRARHAERVPTTGGVLLLANHVSYVDAGMIGAACQRKVRFVMWDELYNLWFLTDFMRIVGSVPISGTRAKDAIRNVAAALKAGEVVCLFPEGQITRHGMLNELRKGFELMARQGDVPVVPVYLAGLYGSIFSFEGGRFFTKWPKRLRYPVSVHFGEPLDPRAASADAVRERLLDLGAEALLEEPELAEPAADAASQQARINALRLLEVEWARKGDTLLCLADEGGPIHRTLAAYAARKPGVRLVSRAADLGPVPPHSVIAVGDAGLENRLRELPDWPQCGRLAMAWTAQADPAPGPGVLRGLLDAASGALLTVSVPTPPLPAADGDAQPGAKDGTLGRLLPGLRCQSHAGGVRLGAVSGADRWLELPGLRLDEQGFLRTAG